MNERRRLMRNGRAVNDIRGILGIGTNSRERHEGKYVRSEPGSGALRPAMDYVLTIELCELWTFAMLRQILMSRQHKAIAN